MDDNNPENDDSLGRPPPDDDWLVEGVDEPLEDEPADDAPLTVADFHTIAQKQILNAVYSVLSESKMDWTVVAPFFEAAREVCIGDIEENAQIRLHSLALDGEAWVEAKEAYIGISSATARRRGMAVRSRWLPRSPWTGGSRQVRAIVRARESTIAKLNAWLDDKPSGRRRIERGGRGGQSPFHAPLDSDHLVRGVRPCRIDHAVADIAVDAADSPTGSLSAPCGRLGTAGAERGRNGRASRTQGE